jgi:signal transduction histidine kinase
LLQEFIKFEKSPEFSLFHVPRLHTAIQELNQHDYDVILLDLTLPDSEGLGSLTQLIKQFPSIPIIVLTNTSDEELAIESVRQGAQDYLVKRHTKSDSLIRSLRYAIERKHCLAKLSQINQALASKLEQQSFELVKAVEMSNTRAEIFSMFSHDVRNPLNRISLAAELLQKYDEKFTKEKKLLHLEIIRSASKNMAQLLDEVSTIGKADLGKLKSQLSPLNLEAFCHLLVREAELEGIDKHIDIMFTSFGDSGQTMWDQNLLRHILSNLLNNAIKYSPPNGKVQFELISQEKNVIFRFQDWGIGISPKDQPYIFELFHRGENVGEIMGSGLGLAIVKRCVNEYSGEIIVNSQVGVGTTFIVTLPLVRY